MLALLLFGSLCLAQGAVFRMQIDDTHRLFVDGVLRSSGCQWNRVYAATVTATSSLALFAENTHGGPQGILMTIDGRPVDISKWKCQTVNNWCDANTRYHGWHGKMYLPANKWGGAKVIAGPRQSFKGGSWWWAATGGRACICRITFGDMYQLQVDDTHRLYVDGVQISMGSKWNQVYTAFAKATTSIALYAENTFGGPQGIMMTFKGKPVDITKWKCKTVSNFHEACTKYRGWHAKSYPAAASWGAAKVWKGPAKSFQGGNWWWAATGGRACVCRLSLGGGIRLQVDDNHRLYVDGVQKSVGNQWNRVYSVDVKATSSIALFAENGGGPQGIMMVIDGKPVDISRWRCQTVSNFNDANSRFRGWYTNSYVAAKWAKAKVWNGPAKSFSGGNWWWAATGGKACICRLSFMKLQVDDTHRLYVDGVQVSVGNQWSRVYTVPGSASQSIALFAENTFGGPQGIMVTIGGKPVDITKWKCQTVSNLADANKRYPGWYGATYYGNWGVAKVWKGPAKKFQGGNWWWAATGGRACICRISYGGNIQLQVDDKHWLWDGKGALISQGTAWNKLYTASGDGPFAIYVENIGGPYGIMVRVNGKVVPSSKMRCKPVRGTLAQFNAAYPGWQKANYNANTWAQAMTSLSAPSTRTVPGNPPAQWSECGCAKKVACKFTA